jgi:hypothetical protein
MSDPLLDTASQRPATGLDQGARELILRVVAEVARATSTDLIDALFADRYGSMRDYYQAVEAVWGTDARSACAQAMSAPVGGSYVVSQGERLRAAYNSLLLVMPEPDFRLAVEAVLQPQRDADIAARRLTEICRARGAPWRFSVRHGFEWVGEVLVEQELLRPAISVLEDSRFAGGVRSEFESARDELKSGTPVARKQAVYEAGCAVESAMKVVLDEHQIEYDTQRDTAHALLDPIVLGATRPRNKKGGHGAGAVAHDVSPEEAEASVASAAGAVAYLGRLLPN